MNVSLDDVLRTVWIRKFTFLATFFLVFFCTYLTLYVFDIVPEAPAATSSEWVGDSAATTASATSSETVEMLQQEELSLVSTSSEAVVSAPTELYFPSLNRTVTVLNPVSRTIADLDEALLFGVVRHPDSALLGQSGTVFILGHSSYLPTVMNRNFQAFNGIQNLQWGDTIELSGAHGTYVYRVERTYKAKAQEVVVPIAGLEQKLVLATCNSFGSVDDRYIVEATLATIR